MITNYPDKWLILEITDKTHGTFRKILGSWYGGYLGSDSYRVSSAVQKSTETENDYEFVTETSVYICRKGSQGMNPIATTVLVKMTNHAESVGSTVKVINDYDWM